MRKHPTVLLLADDQDLRETLEEILAESGYRVIASLRPDRLDSGLGNCSVDAVLADLPAARSPSLELLRKLRAQSPAVPVLLMTSFGDSETWGRAMQLRAAAVLQKPFTTGQLLGAVEAALKERKKR